MFDGLDIAIEHALWAWEAGWSRADIMESIGLDPDHTWSAEEVVMELHAARCRALAQDQVRREYLRKHGRPLAKRMPPEAINIPGPIRRAPRAYGP